MKPTININLKGVYPNNNKHVGKTDERPVSGILIGFQYFDTDLGKPIWWNGESWVDANGENPDASDSEELNEETTEE